MDNVNDETTPARQTAMAAFTPRRAHRCAADNCQTITIELYCWRHKPADVWSEVRNVLDELNQKEGERVSCA